MHDWQWRDWRGASYLTCSLLDGFDHGFFTRQYAPCSPEDLTPALKPEARLLRVKQVHGNRVLGAAEILAKESAGLGVADESGWPQADGSVTDGTLEAAWVCSADCVPALIADVSTGRVAAVHAGWRGTALEIVPVAIARLQERGSRLADLRVALGPAIAGEVYQVSTTVAAEVGATVLPEFAGRWRQDAAPLDPQAPSSDVPDPAKPRLPDEVAEVILETLGSLPHSPLHPDPQPGRVRLDVRRVNALQLLNLGLLPEQVAIAPYCTYQTPELFFSYRRERRKQVQWSGIVSR
ncbi:peptidoglycan editing factor PgeF [Thermoleptolyngbya sp. C42_A2020_037]|uniref:peptidoglycan editing factor PgeF n=1 Tax=Thermoleptolyngbya sp. C42_A2020_037 TaxID=2747799 RepID=UPI0019F9A509|nr:peptidoglycan editing factor PgeF [Thermoleptolyngbya sp. C42_A2020_037]MBF2086731.1 peptidoglycan editing factor PgeF [Thermoleptolyngbya sp. C42_A2020_037]